MGTNTPRRAGGRTLIDVDPGRLSWVLLARESVDRFEQVGNQLTDLRAPRLAGLAVYRGEVLHGPDDRPVWRSGSRS